MIASGHTEQNLPTILSQFLRRNEFFCGFTCDGIIEANAVHMLYAAGSGKKNHNKDVGHGIRS